MKKWITFHRLAALALLPLIPAACSKTEMAGKVEVTFEVEAENLRPGDAVYITGNSLELGDWQPGAVVMNHQGGNLWSVTLAIPYGARLEYKFTLGSWEREAIQNDGSLMQNFRLTAVHSKTYRHAVSNWKSEGIPSEYVTGTVKYHLHLPGEGLSPRSVIVWLPPGYDLSSDHYPVLYAHDGQNLFDPYTSFIGTDWGLDETLTRLITDGEIEPVIVVGIYNSPDRSGEYGIGAKGRSYRRFVIDELKPLIDETYRTRPGPEHTATIGSSMGGLVSFLLAWDHPDVFSRAACLSPAFFTNAVDLVREADRLPPGIRIYMDNGTEGLEQELQPMCENMMDALAAKGYTNGHPDFAWFLDEGAEHNEAAWAARADRPLRFLFGTEDTNAPAP